MPSRRGRGKFASLLDHLVGLSEKIGRQFNAERLGGFEIDDEVEFAHFVAGRGRCAKPHTCDSNAAYQHQSEHDAQDEAMLELLKATPGEGEHVN